MTILVSGVASRLGGAASYGQCTDRAQASLAALGIGTR